jgi:hypothetical protein
MKKNQKMTPRFPSVPLSQLNRRAGKHLKIVYEILRDLTNVDDYSALKISLAEVGEKKADLRAALHRVARKEKIPLATTSDENHLYVFRSSRKTATRS